MNFNPTHILTSIAVAVLFVVNAAAQNSRLPLSSFGKPTRSSDKDRFTSIPDSIDPNSIPKGYYVWSIDERFGSIRPQAPDTLSYLFQNSNYTEGRHGEYNFTGNLGGPRISRIYSGRQDFMMNSQFIFAKPYDYFIKSPQEFLFINTKSPVAVLNYHSAGNKSNGDDHFSAKFATNINKRAGIGFLIDYVYGTGFYKNQQQSSFGGTIYGSYRGDQYGLHAFYTANHLKNIENGGIEDETYITNPEAFPTNYNAPDIPMRLEGVKNRMNVNRLFLTHRYSMGFYEWTDSTRTVVHRLRQDSRLLRTPIDSILPISSTRLKDSTLTRHFVPVASLIHTLKLEHNDRRFSDQNKHDDFFQNFYLTSTTAHDETHYLSLQNTLALEMQEGFRKWVKTGMRLFAKHEFARFTLPDAQEKMQPTHINYLTVGGQLMREKARTFRYNLLGEMRTTGKDWGEFNLEGTMGLHFRLGKDSLRFEANGFIRNENPAFYYEHFHGRNAWWDKDLDKIFRVRAEGRISFHKTQIRVGLETVQNYIYLQETQTASATPATLATMKYGIGVEQTSTNLQLVSATLRQDFQWGIFHWDNEFTLQKSSHDRHLPLPLFTGWSNAYMRFKIAGVLATELGADVRFFTKYYAPAYSPIIGQYAVQDSVYRTKVGNYPWINTYLNFMLKGVRFYLAYTHVNQSAGNYFLVPHYPTNQRTLRFGISWTFFN